MIDVKELRRLAEWHLAKDLAIKVQPEDLLALLDELEQAYEQRTRARDTLSYYLDERSKLIKVLKDAREALQSEKREEELGNLKLGMWTPLNSLRYSVAKCSHIKIEGETKIRPSVLSEDYGDKIKGEG